MSSFVFTCGDVNGIGPEIVIKTLNKLSQARSKNKFYFICPLNIFELTAKHIPPRFSFDVIKNLTDENTSDIVIVNIGNVKQNLGKTTVSSGRISFNSIKTSYSMLLNNYVNAVVTAPISKTAIIKAGIKFSGHTDMLAKWSKSEYYVMTFLSKLICTALVTIHYSLKNVSNLLNSNKLVQIINVIDHTLRIDLNINNPKIAVLGLNPHAGENGLIGNEEIDVIIPAVKECSRKLIVHGPFSPDAFFARKQYRDYDLVLGMYHDQVLIPFKLLNPNRGVNYTAGLPIVRTSPDHGVAYDIAADYVADESSMVQAYKYAAMIVKNRKKQIAG